MEAQKKSSAVITGKQKYIILGFGIGVIIQAAIAVAMWQNTTQLSQHNAQIAHAHIVLEHLALIPSLLTEAESNQRLYLLTGESAYQIPFKTTHSALDPLLAEVRQLTADNPTQQAKLDDLEPLAHQRLNILERAMLIREENGLDAALQYIMTSGGLLVMDAIRDTVKAMQAEEQRLLTLRTEDSQSSSENTIRTFRTGLFWSLLLLGVSFYLLIRQINRQQTIQRLLVRERNLFSTLIDNIPDAVFVKDRESRFLLNNEAHRRIQGQASLETVLNKTDFAFFPHELSQAAFILEQQIFQTGQPLINLEEPIQYSSGEEHWHLTTKVPIRDDQQNIVGLVGISRDITQQKRNEEEIKRLAADLERRALALEAANKELDAFSYTVSHDLRAPLRAIDGFSRILLEQHSQQLTGDAARYLNLVRSNTQQMGLLIDDLLAFSRLGRQAVKRQTVQPADIVRQVLDDLASEREGRNVDVVLHDLLPVEGDPNLLKQVYMNLLSNALKYTRRCENARIEVGVQEQNGEQTYFVRDNGVGFDMQYAQKLFGVFQRMHRAEDYEGTGVGLAIVQRIIHLHGGHIWAEAEVNKGATFYFTLNGGTDG